MFQRENRLDTVTDGMTVNQRLAAKSLHRLEPGSVRGGVCLNGDERRWEQQASGRRLASDSPRSWHHSAAWGDGLPQRPLSVPLSWPHQTPP